MNSISYKDIIFSELGFGCSRLTHVTSPKMANSLLNSVFDNGVNYFDTARLYGLGQSEHYLGKFIKDKRDKVVITTKLGLFPPYIPFRNLKMINLFRDGVKFLKSSIVKSSPSSSQNPNISLPVNNISEAHMRTSLHESLKELQTDYVDFLLLHEFSLELINQAEIINLLEKFKKEGKIRHYGIGTHYSRLPERLSDLPKSYAMIQGESSLLEEGLLIKGRDERLLSIHSIFRDFKLIKTLIENNESIKGTIQDITNLDLQNDSNLINILIAAIKKHPSKKLTLFTTKDKENAIRNINAWSTPSYITHQQLNQIKSIITNR
jgi:aryl-alcohol dehydrogenase-like predicted oxidoreductase